MRKITSQEIANLETIDEARECAEQLLEAYENACEIIAEFEHAFGFLDEAIWHFNSPIKKAKSL